MGNELLWAFPAALSIFGFCLAAYDKLAAVRGKSRVPERTLFLAAFLFGAFGMYLSMLLFRHKTRKKRFMILLPILIAAQAVLIVELSAIWQ